MEADFDKLFDQLKTFSKPPLDKWHPDRVVELDLVIKANGEWFYQESLIRRHRLVKLFATVLRREFGVYYLVTPTVKYRIHVEEAPFRAIELNQQGTGVDQKLYFRTNMDEVVLAGADHPITVKIDESNQQPQPFVEVKEGLDAKISRSVFYELVELAQFSVSGESEMQTLFQDPLNGQVSNDGDVPRNFGVYSNGAFFPLGKI